MSRTPAQEAAIDAAIERLECLLAMHRFLKDKPRAPLKSATTRAAYLTLVHSQKEFPC